MPTDMMWSTNSSLSLKLTWTSLILPLAELFFFILGQLGPSEVRLLTAAKIHLTGCQTLGTVLVWAPGHTALATPCQFPLSRLMLGLLGLQLLP